MINLKLIEKIMYDLEKNNLINDFVCNLFKLKKSNKYIIRYKIKDYFIIDIFDYTDQKRFFRYYFVKKDINIDIIDNDIIINVININKIYKNKYLNVFNSILSNNINKYNIEKVFDKQIFNIIYKYLNY